MTEPGVPSADKKPWSVHILIAITAVMTSALTGLVTYYVQTFSDQEARRDERRIQEIGEFVGAGEQYRGLVSEFMRQFTQSDTYAIERKALLENVRDQYAFINTAKQNLSGADYQRATEYQDRLAKLINLLGKDKSPGESEELVQELVDLLGDEVCVSYSLRAEAGMATSDDVVRECSIP